MIASVLVMAALGAGNAPFTQINDAEASGRIDRHAAAVYRYFAVFEPDRLPRELAADAKPVLRCATGLRLAAIEAARHVPHLGGPQPGSSPAGFWPCNLNTLGHVDSALYPIRVHWDHPQDGDDALDALAAAEYSWALQVDDLGFREPLSDGGQCGGDGRIDIYILRGVGSAYTSEVDDNPATSWDDWSCHIVIDPIWYGGPYLASTVAHELNHAVQAADDWWEILTTLESTATLIEEVAYDGDDFYFDTLHDYQIRAHLPFEYNDWYQTYFLYGGVMYLLFLRDRYTGGDPSFIGEAWLNMRSTARGTYDLPALNEPDFADGIELALAAKAGVSYDETVREFHRWRWFVGSYDDGLHFEEGGLWPENAQVPVLELALDDLPFSQPFDDAAQVGGVRYVQIDTSGAGPGQSLAVGLEVGSSETWLVEALGYDATATPGEWETLFEGTSGAASVDLADVDSLVLLIHHVPAPEYDPDYFAFAGYSYTLDLHLGGSCPWDLDGSGAVGIEDFLELLANWGDPYGIGDFLALLADWGPCP